jgi:hypothetical protein
MLRNSSAQTVTQEKAEPQRNSPSGATKKTRGYRVCPSGAEKKRGDRVCSSGYAATDTS